MEVNPSGVVFIVWCHLPGALPGLLDVDTSGVRNSNITPGFPVTPVLPGKDNGNKTNPTIRDAFPIAPVLPGGDNGGNKVNQPGGLAIQ